MECAAIYTRLVKLDSQWLTVRKGGGDENISDEIKYFRWYDWFRMSDFEDSVLSITIAFSVIIGELTFWSNSFKMLKCFNISALILQWKPVPTLSNDKWQLKLLIVSLLVAFFSCYKLAVSFSHWH